MTEGNMIYIASPYAAPTDGEVMQNEWFARMACRHCIAQGHTPIAVHLLYPQLLDDRDPEQREIGLRLGRRVLEHCDEMWVCGDRISPGMSAEMALAAKLGKPMVRLSAEQILDEPRLIQTMGSL